ncbi:hypothetical protein OROGR_026679 [Orobanche gracilis]
MISDYEKGDVRMSNTDQQSNKHSYFLRAKTRRRRWASDENEASENTSSSFGKKLIVLGKERSSRLMFSSPTPSPGLNSTAEAEEEEEEEEDLANCLVMLSKTSYALSGDPEELSKKSRALSGDQKYGSKCKQVEEKGVQFQCKACKKMFNSHQALGGHRASHKKVKGCFAAKLDQSITDNNDIMDEDSIQDEHESLTSCRSDPSGHVSAKRRHNNKMHECSVCRRVFSSGQALGGHKRCHWLTTSTDNAFIPTFQEFHYSHNQNQQVCKKTAMFTNPHQDENDQEHQLDLNLNLSQVDGKTAGTETTTSRFYIQEQLTTDNNNQQKISNTANGKVENGCSQINKVRNLSDLRDVNYDGGWLQMGIATTADIYK